MTCATLIYHNQQLSVQQEQEETPEPETPPPRPRRRRAAPRVDDSDAEAEGDDRPVAVRRPKRDIRPPGEWWKVPTAAPKSREATPDVWEMRDPPVGMV